MTELETRVAALEIAFVAIGPWLDISVLEDAAADLRGGLGGAGDADERTVRLQALYLIDDARKRFRA